MGDASRFSIGSVGLVPFPFTDQSGTKKRPAVVEMCIRDRLEYLPPNG